MAPDCLSPTAVGKNGATAFLKTPAYTLAMWLARIRALELAGVRCSVCLLGAAHI